jgi:cytidyltransferase-like protein
MSRNFKVVCVSGYFDPFHIGHIDYFKNARLLGDKLVVILNNDQQRTRITPNLLTQNDRKIMIGSIKYVDEVVISIDKNQSVCDTLQNINPDIFAKGTSPPSPEEVEICQKNNIEVIMNVGGQMYIQELLASLR